VIFYEFLIMASRSVTPSYVTLPRINGGFSYIIDFLSQKYPRICRNTWIERMQKGLVADEHNNIITPLTAYTPGIRIKYFREVPEESKIPFDEEIVYYDENIVVADKPHFLPVIPSGPYVNECLLARLRRKMGNENIVPVNRIDRETAGIVLFSVNPETRGKYGRLFEKKRVYKIYEAVACAPVDNERYWCVETRIMKDTPWFRSANVEGEPNSKTHIWLLDKKGEYGYFLIEPITGKNHQIRLHMCKIGCPIKNDFLYPVLSDKPKEGYDAPLQLVSRVLAFTDPISGVAMRFVSLRKLDWQV